MSLNPQASALNEILKNNNPAFLDVLSKRGKAIFWPADGILKQGAEAKGKKINATIGIAMEDNGIPMSLPSLNNQVSVQPQDYLPYAPSFGLKELRDIWLEKMKKKNPSIQTKTTLPIVTSGLTHGLTMTAYLFVDEEDKIILPDKFWGNYKLIFHNGYGAILDDINTFKNGKLDLETFENKLMEGEIGKKIVILNIPNNPTGYSPTTEEAKKIIGIFLKSAEKGNKIVVILDDAYFGLVYEEGIITESLFGRLADLHKNILAIKLDGITKEDYAWGLRVAFITLGGKGMSDEVADSLEQKIAGAIRGNLSNCCHLSQSLMLQTYKSASYAEEKKKKFNTLKSRYTKVQKILNDNKNKYQEFFTPLPFNSGYFMCLELNNKFEGEQIRQILLKNYDTGVIATGKLIRIAFSAVGENQLEELFENIYNAYKNQK